MPLIDGSMQKKYNPNEPAQDLPGKEIDPHASKLLIYASALITGARASNGGVNWDARQLYATYDSLRNSQYQCPSWVTGILYWKKEIPTDRIMTQGLIDYDIFQLHSHLAYFGLRSAQQFLHTRKATILDLLGKHGAVANQSDHDRINSFFIKLDETPPPSFPLDTEEKRKKCRKAIEEVLRELRGYEPFLKQYF